MQVVVNNNWDYMEVDSNMLYTNRLQDNVVNITYIIGSKRRKVL